MALFDSGVPLANVALSDTFNTWRVRTNQINTQAAGLASNNTFTGTLNTFNNTASFKGPVTAPLITANTVNGTAANFTTLQADSIDFDGDLTVDNIAANTAGFAGLVSAPVFNANNLGGTLTTAAQGNITSVGTLTSLSVTGAGSFNGLVTAPKFNANNLGGTLTTAAQGNITSVGTLTSLTVSGSLDAANADFSGPVTAPTVTANSFSGDGSGLTGLSAGLDWAATTSTDEHYLFAVSNTSGSGVDQFNVATGIKIHPGSARITANTFIGDGSGLTGISAGATVTDKSDNVNYNIVFTNETSGTQSLAGIDNAAFTFNPSTGQCNATIFNATSDVALKTNMNVIDDALNIIDKLNGYKFNWKKNQLPSAGVSAQEVEKVLPELVSNDTDNKSVNYNGIVSVLIQAVKELKEEVNSLKNR